MFQWKSLKITHTFASSVILSHLMIPQPKSVTQGFINVFQNDYRLFKFQTNKNGNNTPPKTNMEPNQLVVCTCRHPFPNGFPPCSGAKWTVRSKRGWETTFITPPELKYLPSVR